MLDMVSDAKRARNKWDAANMKIVACKIKKTEAERFRQAAEQQGATPNALLRNYIYEYIRAYARDVKKLQN